MEECRKNSPWYTSKAEPSGSSMTAKLRCVLIAARFKAPRPDQQNARKSTPSVWPGKTSPQTTKIEGISDAIYGQAGYMQIDHYGAAMISKGKIPCAPNGGYWS